MISKYYILFYLYSFLGWLMEEINTYINTKKITKRGFLMEPICPIYGFGSILIILLLDKYKYNIFLLLILSIILCSTLEYLTSYLMEKIFHLRWWDYSKRKYNINGRICLTNTIIFGLFSIILIYIINPFLINILNYINYYYLYLIFITLLIINIIDFLLSIKIVSKLKIKKIKNKDLTIKIKKETNKILKKKITE